MPTSAFIVLGLAYFLGSCSEASSLESDGSLNLFTCRSRCQPQPIRGVRRNDYTYTSDIGAHKVHTQATTWNNARKICKEEGGHLAVINCVAESQVISKLHRNSLPHNDSSYQDYVHIGFHDLFQEGEYVTIHDESLANTGFNEWNLGEPTNGGNIEHCGSIHINGKLNDIWCSQFAGFVCELPYEEDILAAE